MESQDYCKRTGSRQTETSVPGDTPRMKTVRFSNVVEASGNPETLLLFTDPAKDRKLQAAIKAERVMTVLQATVGTASDRGEIGFKLGNSRQFLVFPKSLRRFKGRSVVGIKYDLLRSPEVPKSERAVPASAPKKKKNPAKRPKPHAPAKEKPPKLAKGHPHVHSSRIAANVVPFSSPRGEPVKHEADEITALKNQVRRAMKSLEAGKQVAAFNLLKRAVED
jgi:hypothetical protein